MSMVRFSNPATHIVGTEVWCRLAYPFRVTPGRPTTSTMKLGLFCRHTHTQQQKGIVVVSRSTRSLDRPYTHIILTWPTRKVFRMK